MRKMSILYKISISSLLIALYIILSRFVSIPYLFGLPFVKLSIASSVIGFASLYLGPLFGLIVGTSGDIIGALAFPQGEFNILFTIAASLGGLMPALIYRFIRYTKAEDRFPFVLSSFLVIVPLAITLFITLNESITYFNKTYIFYPRIKWTVSVVSWAVSLLFLMGVIFIRKKFKNSKLNKSYNIYIILSSIFITYVLFKAPVSSLMFNIVYGIDFPIVFGVRLILAFINAFVDSILILIALGVSIRFNIIGAVSNNNRLIKKEVNGEKNG